MVSLRIKALKLALKAIEPFLDGILRYRTVRRILRRFYTISFPHNWILAELGGKNIY